MTSNSPHNSSVGTPSASIAACSPPESDTSLLRKRVPWHERSWISKASGSMAAGACSISAPRLCMSAARSVSRSGAARQLIISTVMRRKVPWPPLPISASRRMAPRRTAKRAAVSPPNEKPPRSMGVPAPMSASSVPPSAARSGTSASSPGATRGSASES
ncbi:hypothetical protein D3C86_1521200 [compost metagenome]